MITKNQVVRLGTLSKPHGIKGEISASLDFDVDLSELKCIVVSIDSIFVPFFVSGIRTKSVETVLIKIDDIDNEEDARNMCGRDYYALAEDVDVASDADDNGGYVSDFVGYTLCDEESREFGRIEDFDDSTDNLLFIVRPAGGDDVVYVPVADDLIIDIDTKIRSISLMIPEGLIDL